MACMLYYMSFVDFTIQFGASFVVDLKMTQVTKLQLSGWAYLSGTVVFLLLVSVKVGRFIALLLAIY